MGPVIDLTREDVDRCVALATWVSQEGGEREENASANIFRLRSSSSSAASSSYFLRWCYSFFFFLRWSFFFFFFFEM